MKMQINILICLWWSFILSQYEASTIHKSNQVLQYLGTRTPYRFKANKNDSTIKFPGCKAKKIWMIVRHGTRLPGPDDIEGINLRLKDMRHNILLNHGLGKGNLSEKQLSRLKDWFSSIDIKNEKFLAVEGQDEMVLLSKRMQKRFPGIIKDSYDNDTFMFKYTATERTQQSARYFASGLFEQKHDNDLAYSAATAQDVLLRFYKHCDKWQKQVKANPDTYKELKQFIVSKAMNSTLENVSKTLGFDKVLSFGDLKLMFKMCGYETAWNKHFPSPWCAVFDKETAEVMEYFFDLKHYWVDGYGFELTYRQACVSIKNMFEHFSYKNKPKAVFYFAHSGTLLKILSHLGLYKPTAHLTANNYSRDRPWKTTDIDCFATNLAFVLFGCKDGEKVLTMHQERIIKLPPCDQDLCPLEVLRNYYLDSIFNCNFNIMCRLNKDEL